MNFKLIAAVCGEPGRFRRAICAILESSQSVNVVKVYDTAEEGLGHLEEWSLLVVIPSSDEAPMRVVATAITPETLQQQYGGRKLTKREFEVAQKVAVGWGNRLIGLDLQLQEQSVKNLVSSVMRKLRCDNRTQVANKINQLR